MFVIKANTPEAMRHEIVKWLNQMASQHRIAASKLAGLHKKEVQLARATTYEGAAKFLEGCTVENNNTHIELAIKWRDDYKEKRSDSDTMCFNLLSNLVTALNNI